ncbi:phosphate ABC transporter substrate-binding protein PstS [Actinophytocola xinjiangensis]|uniref:Phosphate-binding protein n=1 Tax=Actinophytocola xinjiangensis TaxID=485602 RepID=A0A7Z0WLX5_9PSEU|nr:phosphate ABC transporter substrate-binding protein PstS [Actinophytocola xinjiangensis]OLF09708.1 phosphate ABC transporter substrate-binding protein PstS [Actinophytocola xinjiangensis]
MRLRVLPAVLSAAVLAGCGAAPAPVGGGADSPVRCASGSVTAEGSTAQANAINTWITTFQAACPDATVEYRSSGSGAGLRAFIAGTSDFAGSDAELAAADQPAADARCATGPAIHLPMVVGPIALAYTVAGVEDLRLSPPTIAGIFSGRVTRWNDPAIAGDNPDAALPPTAIRTIHRADGSGTTDSFTRYLTATAAGDWPFGSGTAWPAPGGTAEKGNGGVAAAVAETNGSIGYLEGSYAQALNLRTARIGNQAGEFVELSAEAGALAVADADVAGTGNDLRLRIAYTSEAAGVYPIVLVTYEVVCERGTRSESLDLVKAFLRYAAGEDGQRAASRLGYSPLPERIRTRVVAAVDALA